MWLWLHMRLRIRIKMGAGDGCGGGGGSEDSVEWGGPMAVYRESVPCLIPLAHTLPGIGGGRVRIYSICGHLITMILSMACVASIAMLTAIFVSASELDPAQTFLLRCASSGQ